MTHSVEFTSQTARLGLPYLFAGQAQKELFVNAALQKLDMLVQAAVEGQAQAPPTAPNAGECWIIAASAAGEWGGREGEMACWVGDQWRYAKPQPGMSLFDKADETAIIFIDGAWRKVNMPGLPEGGTVIDSEMREAFSELVLRLKTVGVLG